MKNPSNTQKRLHSQGIAERASDQDGGGKSEEGLPGKDADELFVHVEVGAQIIEDGRPDGKHHGCGQKRDTTGDEKPLALACGRSETPRWNDGDRKSTRLNSSH